MNLKNLSIKKRPIIAVADNQEVKYADSITITTSKKIKFKLLFDKRNSLQKFCFQIHQNLHMEI